MEISPVNAQSVYSTAASAAKSADSSPGIDFSAVISDALKDEYSQKALSMMPSATSGSSDMSSLGMTGMADGGAGIEQMILAAAASGEADDTMMAVMMLLMMLQNEAEGEMSQLFGMMSALITQLDSNTQKQVYTDVMDSDNPPADLLDLESGIFLGTEAASEVTRTGAGAVVPAQAWKAATPSVMGGESSRSPQALREIISQFDVENAERYRPFKNGKTYCNIFVWDVTSALGCEIPHYIDSETGAPRQYPDVAGAWEMNANATCDWLAGSGQSYGWREVSAEQAQQWANAGRPAVTAWKNEPDKPGHVQIVCPSEDGGFDPVRGVTVAQAGSRVTEYAHISSTFKQSDLKNVRYYIHD